MTSFDDGYAAGVKAERKRAQGVGADVVGLINEALARLSQGKSGVETYLFLARGRLKDNKLTPPDEKR